MDGKVSEFSLPSGVPSPLGLLSGGSTLDDVDTFTFGLASAADKLSLDVFQLVGKRLRERTDLIIPCFDDASSFDSSPALQPVGIKLIDLTAGIFVDFWLS